MFAALKARYPALSASVEELVDAFYRQVPTYATLDVGAQRLLDALERAGALWHRDQWVAVSDAHDPGPRPRQPDPVHPGVRTRRLPQAGRGYLRGGRHSPGGATRRGPLRGRQTPQPMCGALIARACGRRGSSGGRRGPRRSRSGAPISPSARWMNW